MFDVESEGKPAIAVDPKHWCLWPMLCPIPTQRASRSCSAAASRLVGWNPRDNQIKVRVESHFAWSAVLGLGENAWTAFLGNHLQAFGLQRKTSLIGSNTSVLQGFHNYWTFSGFRDPIHTKQRSVQTESIWFFHKSDYYFLACLRKSHCSEQGWVWFLVLSAILFCWLVEGITERNGQ